MLEKELNELKEQFAQLQKNIQKDERKNIRSFREMTNDMKEQSEKIKEFNEKLLDFSNTIKLIQERKDWIDAFIEKIKKVLPII